MSGTTISISVGDSDVMSGYYATPVSGNGPGIVLLHEIFGVNAAMRAAADDFAKAGFCVLVPDLFWRIEPGISLGYSDEERALAFGYWKQFDTALGAKDAVAAFHHLRTLGGGVRKCAYLGFCLGGKLAVLAGANSEIDAVVSLYGTGLQENHAELHALTCPFQFHVGSNDAHVPTDVVGGIRRVLESKTDADIFVYDGAKHGFFNKTRLDVYDHAYAELASERIISFLRTALG